MSADCACAEEPAPYTVKDYRSDLKPIWCPGCGDYGVVTAIYRALVAIGRPPHEIAFVSGIGCSSRIPGYTTAYGFNTVHGRALPIFHVRHPLLRPVQGDGAHWSHVRGGIGSRKGKRGHRLKGLPQEGLEAVPALLAPDLSISSAVTTLTLPAGAKATGL